MKREVVVITGCSKGGIGYALSKEFSANGCQVFATARRLEAMEGLQENGIQTLQLDVASDKSIRAAIDSVLQMAGGIDILVNNAGLWSYCPILETPIEEMRALFETNVLGVMAVTQAVAPHMVERGSGKIVNVGSIVGYVAHPFGGPYGATKAALHSLTDTLRRELRPFGVQVLLMAPGVLQTNFFALQAESLRSRVLQMYEPLRPAMEKGLKATLDTKSMSLEHFAKRNVKKILQRAPPRHFSVGSMVGLFRFFELLPRWACDVALCSAFGLSNRIRPQSSKKSIS